MTKSTSANLKQPKAEARSIQAWDVRLPLLAEDHLYFNVKKPSLGASFEELGIQGFAMAPKKGFIPDLSKLARAMPAGNNLFEVLGQLSQELDDRQLRLLSVVFNNMSKMKAHGLHFGQKVYVNVSSPRIDYIECYAEAIVIGAESEHPESAIYLSCSHEGMAGDTPMFWSMTRGDFLTEREFRKLRRTLRAAGKATVPDALRKSHLCWERDSFGKPSNALSIDETVQTMDTVPQDWLNDRVLELLAPLQDPMGLEDSEDTTATDAEPTSTKKATKASGRKRRGEDNITLDQVRITSSGGTKLVNNKVTFDH